MSKASSTFIVLCTVAICIFVGAMLYIASLPTPEKKREMDMQQMQAFINAEHAQSEGISVVEY
jgi:hypothetical protein